MLGFKLIHVGKRSSSWVMSGNPFGVTSPSYVNHPSVSEASPTNMHEYDMYVRALVNITGISLNVWYNKANPNPSSTTMLGCKITYSCETCSPCPQMEGRVGKPIQPFCCKFIAWGKRSDSSTAQHYSPCGHVGWVGADVVLPSGIR